MQTPSNFSERLCEVLLEAMDVCDKDARLIELYAAPEADADAWAALFADVNPQRETWAFNYMLTRLAVKFGWELFPAADVPLYQGLRRKFLAQNMTVLSGALRYVRILNDHEIPALITKGAAMRLVFLPNVPQRIADADIVVARDAYNTCRELGFSSGYTTERYVPYSTDFAYEGHSCVDLHNTLFKSNVYRDEPLDLVFARGSEIKRQGARFYVPSPEDVFLHVMVNAAYNYLAADHGKGPISWLADCIDLAESYEISYADVVEHAREYGVWAHFQMAVVLMRHFLPDVFAELIERADVHVSHELLERVERSIGHLGGYHERAAKLSGAQRMVFAGWYICAEHLYNFHMDDPLSVAVADFPASLKKRLKTLYGVEHITQVPALVGQRVQAWRQEGQGK